MSNRLSSYCKECCREKSKHEYLTHTEERKILNKEYYENNKEKCKKLQREYEKRNLKKRNEYKNSWRNKQNETI